MTSRIYAVAPVDGSDFHLVEATSKQAALRHVTQHLFEVKVADQKTLVGAIQAGVKVMVANPAPVAEEVEA